jgi:hypothetical protein
MILYHFTRQFFLEGEGGTILEGGLLPSWPELVKFGWSSPPHSCVWLTKLESVDLKEMRAADCRITVAIPSTDRRLVRWRDWLREHDPDLIEWFIRNGRNAGLKAHYCYFGVVPPSAFLAIEDANPEIRAVLDAELGYVPEEDMLTDLKKESE